MPHITLQGPEPAEEVRLLEEVLADGHSVGIFIFNHAEKLVSGECVHDLRGAWRESESNGLFKALVDECQRTLQQQYPAHSPDDLSTALKNAGLSGETGKAKRQMLARLKDRFFGLFYSEPKAEKGRSRLSAALVDYLEYLATLVGSIGSFLKSMGYDLKGLFESLKELLDLIKQMAKLRAKRSS